LAVNDYVRERIGQELHIHPDYLPIQYGMISGATAGFCQVIATNPMEITKIQLQISQSESIRPIQVVKQLGIRGLYRGTFATLSRDVPFSIIFFSLVSLLKEWGTVMDQPTSLPVIFASGILSGAIAAASVTPMDVVKTKLQVIRKPGEYKYIGQIDCYK
jgi:hypothetical protein